MKTELVITPVSNIDQLDEKVNDIGKVQKITLDWKEEITIYNMKADKVDTILVREVSLYDHNLIWHKVRHKILYMSSHS